MHGGSIGRVVSEKRDETVANVFALYQDFFMNDVRREYVAVMSVCLAGV